MQFCLPGKKERNPVKTDVLARNMYSKDQMDFIIIIYLASKGCLSVQYTDHCKLIKDNKRVETE